MTKSYYQNRAGTYFFEALDDDKTRRAYELMGYYIMPGRKSVPKLNMRPRIDLGLWELEQIEKYPEPRFNPETNMMESPDGFTDEYTMDTALGINHVNPMSPVVYEVWELFQGTIRSPEFEGAERIELTASDLLGYFWGTIVGKLSPREFTNRLFSPDVVEDLADLGISVSRRKSNGRRLIVIDRGKA